MWSSGRPWALIWAITYAYTRAFPKSPKNDILSNTEQLAKRFTITYVSGDIAYISAKDLSLVQIDSLTGLHFYAQYSSQESSICTKSCMKWKWWCVQVLKVDLFRLSIWYWWMILVVMCRLLEANRTSSTNLEGTINTYYILTYHAHASNDCVKILADNCFAIKY